MELSRLDTWGGVARKTFVGETSPFNSDYEAAGYLVDGVGKPAVDLAILRGQAGTGLLIAMPLTTSLVSNEDHTVCFIQIHYCEAGWSFDFKDRHIFEQIDNLGVEYVDVSFNTENLLIFDSACPGDGVDDNFIQLNVRPGLYRVKAAPYEPNTETLLTVIKFDRK